MNESRSRREFFFQGVALAALLLPAAGIAEAQQSSDAPPKPHAPPITPPDLRAPGAGSGQSGNFPPPADGRHDPSSVDAAAPTPDPKEVLKANDKDIKSNVLRLSELAQELKKEVEKTDSANVLSLPMVHKAEEIEKLAHHIATLARG